MHPKKLIDFEDRVDDLEVFIMTSMGEIEPENVYALFGQGQ